MKNTTIIYLIAILIAVISIPLIVIPMTPAENPKVIYHDSKGDVTLVKWYFTPKGGNPGDQITVRGYIYNGRSEPIKLYAESGIAKHGWQYFSIYGTPIKAQIEGGPCCKQNEFYDGGYFTIQPHQYVYVEFHPHLPTQNSYDHCHNLGSVWNGINKDYDIAFIVDENFQGRGIATFMLNYIITIAQKKGIKKLNASVLTQNEKMINVFQKGRVKPKKKMVSNGVIEFEFIL